MGIRMAGLANVEHAPLKLKAFYLKNIYDTFESV